MPFIVYANRLCFLYESLTVIFSVASLLSHDMKWPGTLCFEERGCDVLLAFVLVVGRLGVT